MQILSVFAVIGLVQAGQTFTNNGFTYTITMRDNGIEVPNKYGPSLSRSNSSSLSKSSIKHGKRDGGYVTNNWCGIIDCVAPSGSWANVQRGWFVPKISLRDGQPITDRPSISQWVGIEGGGCGVRILQGGTISQITGKDTQRNYAWFEFLPDPTYSFDMDVNIGDQMHGNITRTGYRSGYIEVSNLSVGKSVAVHIADAPSDLCGYSVEWVLEDASAAGGRVPFAQFPNNAFYLTKASTTDSKITDACQGTHIDMVQNGKNMCSGAFANGNVESTSIARKIGIII